MIRISYCQTSLRASDCSNKLSATPQKSFNCSHENVDIIFDLSQRVNFAYNLVRANLHGIHSGPNHAGDDGRIQGRSSILYKAYEYVNFVPAIQQYHPGRLPSPQANLKYQSRAKKNHRNMILLHLRLLPPSRLPAIRYRRLQSGAARGLAQRYLRSPRPRTL